MTMGKQDFNKCPLCSREIIHKSIHHLIPKSRGGKEIILICSDCHNAIHATFSNKKLEQKYHTVQALTKNAQLAKLFKFISKQNPHKRHCSKTSKRKRK